MHIRFILLWMGSLFIVSCTSPQSSSEKAAEDTTLSQNTSEVNTPAAIPAETAVTNPTPEPAGPEGYHKQLITEQYTFDVALRGESIMKNLIITARQNGQKVAEVKDSVDGEITQTLSTDLNQNQKPEVLVFMQSSGSGGYGLLYGYEMDGDTQRKISLPPLKGELAEGYMGQDQFKVDNNQLIRTFPVYKETDINAKPTGGSRAITYRLTPKLDWEVVK